MKEVAKDGAEVGGFKTAKDGWHIGEFLEGIAFMTGKGGEGIWQDDQGNKAYNIPVRVVDPDDEDNGATLGLTVFTKGGGEAMASVLAAAGLWDAVQKKFPGDDVSVFDQPVMDGVKTRLPGRSCMVRSQVDKKGFARVVQVASFAKYKEILAEEKTKGAGKKGEKKEKAPETAGAAGGTSTGTAKEDW